MNKRQQFITDVAVVIIFAGLTIHLLGIDFLNSANTPTGGDSASHLLYAHRYSDNLLFSGKILPWMPEVFAGFPFLSYYFPLPFIVMATMSKFIGFAPAFKWGSFAAAILLPGAVHVAGRRWLALPWAAAVLGACGTFAFLLHEQNSIWGGNLLSILSGEFAYSYGILFATLACLAWVRAPYIRGGWIIAALLEAATGFSHGFTLLVAGFSTLLLLIETDNPLRTIRMLICGHLLAFCLLGGWLWPMLEMHGYTIPNDGTSPLSGWQSLLPLSLRPVFAAGLTALPICLFSTSVRGSITSLQAKAIRYFAGSAALACLAFIAGDQIGLANIRFFPMTWLFCAIISGWSIGFVLSCLPTVPPTARILFTTALLLGVLGWMGQTVKKAPDWSLWNHTGLESKPQWHNLTKLFPVMKGSLWSPRLLHEYDPANNDLGSPRTLESLPLFIDRPVLEGLYMESALTGPAIYQLQAEVSTNPLSPLVRFPSSGFDPAFAATHMRFMHADTLLLRSAKSKKAVEKCDLFMKVAESPPFALYRVKEFSSRLAEVVDRPISIRPIKGWMEDAFIWFRSSSRFKTYQPVYGAPTGLTSAPSTTVVREIGLERDRLHFKTDDIGKPHLIKVSWHPRWRLSSAGRLYLTAPGFMLVVPQEKDIILEFGHTIIGYAGMASTAAALVATIFCWLKRDKFFIFAQNEEVSNRPVLYVKLAVYWAGIVFFSIRLAVLAPERAYGKALQAQQAKQYDEAAFFFQRAFERRRPPARKEEALFWLAKTNELRGNKEEALKRYFELTQKYHGLWLPESLYKCVRLGAESGKRAISDSCAAQLQEEYPDNVWTAKLNQGKKHNTTAPNNGITKPAL